MADHEISTGSIERIKRAIGLKRREPHIACVIRLVEAAHPAPVSHQVAVGATVGAQDLAHVVLAEMEP
jgi:hypothetical protein